MQTRTEVWSGARVAICAPEGPLLAAESDINDFIGEAWAHDASWLVVPVSRLGPAFLQLRTRLAGEAAQKFVNYRVGLAIVGDISAAVAGSEAMGAYVRESNRGNHVLFMPDLTALRAALTHVGDE